MLDTFLSKRPKPEFCTVCKFCLQMACEQFHSVLSAFTGSFEEVSQQRDDKAEIFKSITKTLYDTILETDDEKIYSEALPSLIIEEFDEEQVWQQVELQNKHAIVHFRKCLKRLPSHITFGVKKRDSQDKRSNFGSTEVDVASDERSDYAFDGSDSDDSRKEIAPVVSVLNSQKAYRSYNSESVVDDRFFKVSQLENFLKFEDLKEEKGQLHNGSDESDIDLFADIPSDDDAIDDETRKDEQHFQSKKLSKEIMYQDFFDPPEDVEDKSSIDPKFDIFDAEKDKVRDGPGGTKKTVRFNQNIGTSGKLQLLDDSDDDCVLMESEKSTSKTAFEKQQEKEHRRIEQIHKSMLGKTAWELTGEVACVSRPHNSLCYEEIVSQSGLKQDFVATDEINEQVENIIKMAIMNKAWCDPEVKVKPVDCPSTYKPLDPLDQSKSKKSLAEVYEMEYEKLHEKENDKDEEQHLEIKKLMGLLTSALCALFGNIPRPPVPEIKVVNNMSAITVEEVAPVSVSDATLLAPEEIKPKSGLPIGRSERTETDKKRERRKKKILQKAKKLEMEEKAKMKASVSKKEETKFLKEKALKKLSQQKNVTIINEKKHMGKKKRQH